MTSGELAREIEQKLLGLIINNSNIECDENEQMVFEDIEDVRTFEEASYITRDKGLVLNFKDGSEVNIVIQAWRQ